MSAERNRLKLSIKQALTLQGTQDPSAGAAMIEQIAERIALAVDQYTVQKLNKLKTAVVAPGAFVGSGTGVVAITPGSMTTYNPES